MSPLLSYFLIISVVAYRICCIPVLEYYAELSKRDLTVQVTEK